MPSPIGRSTGVTPVARSAAAATCSPNDTVVD
uniref:Uncharacterized protein n=1 Tax=Arundo donax TaxID=35708 RepID=A0A0A9AJC5_ARUDO